MLSKLKLVYRSDDGYSSVVYAVKNTDNNTVGTYTLRYRQNGTLYGVSSDYHKLAKPGARDAYQAWIDSDYEGDYAQAVMPCEYWDDADCHCDGSSLVDIYPTERERWACAEMMAS